MGFVVGPKLAQFINWSILICGTGSGLFHDEPKLFYQNMVFLFLFISIGMNLMGLALHILGMLFGKKCQPDAPKPPKYLRETLETLSSYYCVSWMAAWPYTNYHTGKFKGYVWDIKDSALGDSIILNALFVVVFIIFIDFFNYWKHYLLHSKMLFIFHEPHHQYANPSVQAVFAITPVESLWSFGLIYLDCLPIANDYPLCIWFHGSLILGFAILNLYLHCGYTFDWVEWLLPRLLFNTSDFHNYHHLKVNINFGELGCLWDLIRGTGATVYNKEKFEAENPKYARKLKQG